MLKNLLGLQQKESVGIYLTIGVYNPNKPKIRVVFDCSSKYNDRSFNSEVMSGPNSTNLLLGVLIRFRQDKVAFMGDIE